MGKDRIMSEEITEVPATPEGQGDPDRLVPPEEDYLFVEDLKVEATEEELEPDYDAEEVVEEEKPKPAPRKQTAAKKATRTRKES
jgi:hypothetical protein